LGVVFVCVYICLLAIHEGMFANALQFELSVRLRYTLIEF